MYYRVLVASQRFHGKDSLSYESSEKLLIGQLVSIPLQNRTVLGIVESIIPKPEFSTKQVAEAWPLLVPLQSLELLKWSADYYPAPLGLITELFTPPNLPKKLPEPGKIIETKRIGLPPLTAEQIKILKSVQKAGQKSILLHGDTGTGKTRIYIELAKQMLKQNKSVIVLTPEIGLTEPLLDTFKQTFGNAVFVTHSNMTPAQRRNVWLAASRSDKGLIIIGPRSALFSPLKRIGLIVMDEAHDGAYKQEQAPHYQTSRVAAKLANIHGSLFVMGTATPNIADQYAFEHKSLSILRMVKPALEIGHDTTVEILDLKNQELFTRSRWLANNLVNAIEDAIKNSEQSLLFLNRRGSARLVLCDNCGWQALCPNCDVALTYHQDQHTMRCHSCEFSGAVPTSCPKCGNGELIFRSIGTKALEAEVKRLFPRARVSRFDRDTDKLLRLTNQFEALHTGKIDIIIGTQSVAKGFDLPKLSVVGIVQADSGLQLPDYTATERTYQLISQVSGRIGRGHRKGRLFVQTFEPGSPLIAYALNKDYTSFYDQELKQRQLYKFPPYVHLLKVSCSRSSSRSSFDACQKLVQTIRSVGKSIIIEGPSPRFIEKIAGRYSWHIVIKSKNRKNLTDIVAILPSNCTYDLDPNDLLQ